MAMVLNISGSYEKRGGETIFVIFSAFTILPYNHFPSLLIVLPYNHFAGMLHCRLAMLPFPRLVVAITILPLRHFYPFTIFAPVPIYGAYHFTGSYRAPISILPFLAFNICFLGVFSGLPFLPLYHFPL